MIVSVKYRGAGKTEIIAAIDGEVMTVPVSHGNRRYQQIAPYAAPPTTAEDIKAEAGRRIVARYPEWKQRNMTARGVELLHIKASRPWTAAERFEADDMEDTWAWIASVRAASDTLEAAQPIPADWRDDPHWPE